MDNNAINNVCNVAFGLTISKFASLFCLIGRGGSICLARYKFKRLRLHWRFLYLQEALTYDDFYTRQVVIGIHSSIQKWIRKEKFQDSVFSRALAYKKKCLFSQTLSFIKFKVNALKDVISLVDKCFKTEEEVSQKHLER